MERPVVHIAIVCGFLQGASAGRTLFFFVIHPMYQTVYSYGRNNSSLPCHDLTLSVGEPENAAAQTGAGTSFGANGDFHYMSSTASTYFLRLNNSEIFVELVGVRPLHLLSQTVLPLKSPTGAFIAALHFANAVPPQTLLIFAPVLPRKPHRRNCVKLTQFLLSPCRSIGEITLGIFQRLFQKFQQLIRIIIHPMVGLRKFNIVVWNVVQNVRSH